jgi:hypothetical protein
MGPSLTMTEQFPVIIIVRDRLTPLLQLLRWLEKVEQRDIWLCDNASTWPAMVDFLATTSHKVVRNGANLGHRAPWLSGIVADVGFDRYFVVTDPDVVPVDSCPDDALATFKRALQRNPGIDKVGFSLKIDDLPACYRHRDDVITWEKQFWTTVHEPGFYRAPVDTTLAVYRPGLGHDNGNALRSAPPYVARHLPWYADSANPTEEDRHYVARADRLIMNWNDERLPANVKVQLDRLRSARIDPS